MKKKTLIIVGICLCASFTIGAASGVKVTAELKEQQITYKDNIINQGILSYKDTTYVPLKAFGNLLEIPVNYKNGIIYLGDKTEGEISYWGKEINHMALSKYAFADYTYNGTSCSDTTGNAYTNYLKMGASMGDGYVEFPLNGKYNRFEAILAIPKGNERQEEVKLKIYVDGKEVYTKTHSPSHMPENININITGGQKITFEIESDDLYPTIGLFNGKFIK